MDRNREAFRKRFLAYKDGKSVGEIYGIPKFEDGRSGKVDWKRWDDAQTTSYTVPFIEDKAITLTNAGRATGARLSTNLLDSLADNAMRAEVPVRTAIGLATKESTLGNPTDDRTAWNQSSAIRQQFNGIYPGTHQHINGGRNLIHGQNLINYHKGDIDNNVFTGAPHSNSKSVIQEGLEFYRQHPDRYNPGQPGYQKAIKARGNEVMKSPEVLKWYKEWEAKQVKVMRPKPYSLPTILDTAPKKFGKYEDGKLPKYGDGTIPFIDEQKQQKVELWSDNWLDRLLRSAGSKVLLKWNATGEKPKPESSEQYTKRRTKETEWKKPSGRKMLEIAPAVVDAVPIASDVKLALEAGAAALRRNYLEASLLSGGLLLPGLFKKTGKFSLKFLSKDELYKAAVERGDKLEALRLLEDAYLNSGVNKTPIVVGDDGHAVGWFHGSEWGNHTIFDSSAMNATIGGSSAAGKVKGNFLTTDLPSAKRYAGSSRYSTTEDPKTTTPNTFVEKLLNLFGAYQPRFLYPAERVGGYAPKPERLFDTHGLAPINHLDKTDNVVYPMYVNPGENPMVLDFNGKPWSQSPVLFPNNFYLKRYIRDDKAKTYRDVIIPFKDKETAMEAWMSDPINVRRGVTNLDDKYFDEGIRSISAYNSAPRYETVELIEELVPNTTNGAVQTAAKEGNSSVLLKNVIDSNGGPNGLHYAIDDLATLKSELMKLADITYDDAGNLIPLSKRFDWTNPDIRYMLAPFLIGGAGYGAYNRLSSYKDGKLPIKMYLTTKDILNLQKRNNRINCTN